MIDRLLTRLCLLLFAVSLHADACQTTHEVSRESLSLAPNVRWKLPDQLREISALALDTKQNLYALEDEHATIYQLDFERGAIVNRIFPGRIKGDFEGLAVVDDRFYLITSQGILFVVQKLTQGELSTRSLDTGLADRCEVEGLTYRPPANTLLIACKKPLTKSLIDSVTLFQWSVEDEALIPGKTISVPLQAIAGQIGREHFNPSAVAIDPNSSHIILIAARQQAMAVLTPEGQVLRVFRLPHRKHHPQPEGLAMTRAGQIIVADEGGKDKARLAVYTLKDYR